ncbi:MAG: S9 family peptidase, partial [Novosphingobium sp.]|nr:S9 family peptidase [Novosphingobium sp.]
MADTTHPASEIADSPPRPPLALKKPSTVTHHGQEVSDDYAWLRDPGYPEVTDPEVLAYLEAENAWFEARMAPHQGLIDRLFKEMRGRIKEADTSVPQKDGDWLYWIQFEEGAEYKMWWRRAVGAPDDGSADRLILDELALAEGKEYFRLGALAVSQDGRKLAYSI